MGIKEVKESVEVKKTPNQLQVENSPLSNRV